MFPQKPKVIHFNLQKNKLPPRIVCHIDRKKTFFICEKGCLAVCHIEPFKGRSLAHREQHAGEEEERKEKRSCRVLPFAVCVFYLAVCSLLSLSFDVCV